MAVSRNMLPFVAIIALVAGPRLAQSLDIEYCASLNTAGTPTNSSIWQSNGLCHDFCVDQSFAFAILQQHDCWCSDYIPTKSSQVDTGECNDSCPGWKDDTCGGDNLFGYIALGLTPSGTAAGSSTSATSTTSTTSTSSTSIGQTSTTTVKTSSTATSAVHSTATSTSTTASTLPNTNTQTTPTPDPTTSVRTVTASGTVSLETVTVIPTSNASSGADTSASESHGPSSGAIAGIAIGVLGIVAIIAGLAVFFYLQRKKRQREEELASRPNSHLSGSVGIMSTPTTAMASVWDGENTSTGRRSSRLMPHDPRMDPFATNIYSRFENKSRESINTLQDNQDYSRKVLRTTNPDPPDD
ncbi:hypothetical protein F4679DRAFT_596005 [Xylaria curta]|nr:hypothetical protein F4679DRAFT_596005 [Xylaria curta]